MKKWICLLLCLVMTLSLMPAAFAEEAQDEPALTEPAEEPEAEEPAEEPEEGAEEPEGDGTVLETEPISPDKLNIRKLGITGASIVKGKITVQY